MSIQNPTLTQIQSWVGILNSELPAFIQESITSGLLHGDAIAKAQEALTEFQTVAAQFLSPTFDASNQATLISEIGTALTTVLEVIPATAPYVGLLQLVVLLISGFVATKE